MRDLFIRLRRNEGARGFYKGIGPNVIRVTPACCITFVVYENVSRLLLGQYKWVTGAKNTTKPRHGSGAGQAPLWERHLDRGAKVGRHSWRDLLTLMNSLYCQEQQETPCCGVTPGRDWMRWERRCILRYSLKCECFYPKQGYWVTTTSIWNYRC